MRVWHFRHTLAIKCICITLLLSNYTTAYRIAYQFATFPESAALIFGVEEQPGRPTDDDPGKKITIHGMDLNECHTFPTPGDADYDLNINYVSALGKQEFALEKLFLYRIPGEVYKVHEEDDEYKNVNDETKEEIDESEEKKAESGGIVPGHPQILAGILLYDQECSPEHPEVPPIAFLRPEGTMNDDIADDPYTWYVADLTNVKGLDKIYPKYFRPFYHLPNADFYNPLEDTVWYNFVWLEHPGNQEMDNSYMTFKPSDSKPVKVPVVVMSHEGETGAQFLVDKR